MKKYETVKYDNNSEIIEVDGRRVLSYGCGLYCDIDENGRAISCPYSFLNPLKRV